MKNHTIQLIRHVSQRALAAMARKSVMALGIAALAFSAVAYAAPSLTTPPANTQIGNQASATYVDASLSTRTATSNTVITVVQQVASFTLTASQSKYSSPGGQVFYPHTLINTGNGPDTFDLSATNNAAGDDYDLNSLTIYADVNGDGVPDNATPIASTGVISSGSSFQFVVVGIVPGTQTSGTSNITITAQGNAAVATSGGYTAASAATNVDTTSVTTNAVVAVTKAISAASGTAGSGPYTYTITYNNTGNSPAKDVTITDVIPTGMTYVSNSGGWSVTGTGTPLLDGSATYNGVSATGTTTLTYDYGVTQAGRVTAVVSVVQPGETRQVTFQVNIAANATVGTIPNTANYTYIPSLSGSTALGPYPTNTPKFNVLQSAAVDISGQTVASASQGSTVTFTNPVVNSLTDSQGRHSNGSDSYDIVVNRGTFPAGTTFQLYQSDGQTPLVDANGNTTPDTGTITLSGTYQVVVKAILPTSATGGPYTATVVATSKFDPSVSSTANDVLTLINGSTVDLTNNAPVGSGGVLGTGAGPEGSAVVSGTINPGSTFRFTLYVNNTSAVADSYNLAVSTDSTFGSQTLPSGWTVVFHDGNGAVIASTNAIASGSSQLVYADVSVPAGYAPGANQIYFRALSPTTDAADRIHDAVVINTVRSIALNQNNSGQVSPGGSVTYTHIMTNNGNVLEGDGSVSNITLSSSNSLSNWSSVIYYDTNGNGLIDAGEPIVTDLTFSSNGGAGLAAGETIRLLVKVIAPPGAAPGAIDTTTITATTANGSYTTTIPTAVSVTDNSTVIPGDLIILKEQALDANLDGVPDTAYSTANITAGAKPGAGICYRITATNYGTSDATTVVLYDATPSYTTYNSTVAAQVTYGGSSHAATTAPSNGAAGSLTWTVGTLTPGQSAVATFAVKINP